MLPTHQTRRIWISRVTRRASTICAMIDDGALRGRWTVARVNASLVATGQRGCTIYVSGALRPLAYSVRITLVSFGTVAPRSVVPIGCTERVDPALGHQAGIHALVVDAGLSQRALAVPATSDCKKGCNIYDLNLRDSICDGIKTY